jgi:hypothetical protein
LGAEFSFEYQWTATIKGGFSAAYGKYTYDSDPNLSVNNDALATVENTNPSFDFGKALLKFTRRNATASLCSGDRVPRS